MPDPVPLLVLRSSRVLLPEGERPASVEVADGRIARVLALDDPAAAGGTDLGDLVLMPGLVDTHVHLNEPGNTEWEGFATGTAAALAGGFTTVVDMPLNSLPVTTTPEALTQKRAAAKDKLSCRVGFWGGVTGGMGEAEIEALLDAGVWGLKAFLCDSGLASFGAAGEAELRVAMAALARRGLPLLAHAELATDTPAAAPADPRSHDAWLASRPPSMERDAIALLVRLCRETGCRTHVVHVADAGSLPLIAEAKAAGLPLTAETCPHHLCFAAEEIPAGATAFKCAPPIRDAANREMLWAGLADGTLDLVASDHSPCPPSMKAQEAGDFVAAWGGIASLEVSFAATWAEASRRGFGLADVVRWMGERPAALAGRTFGIAEGHPADLVALDPDARWTVRGAELHHRHPLTPHEGREVRGLVKRAWIGGRPAGPGILQP
ncbi:allantoinase AllB [Phycisphaera mikurensis]|uniref:allantoinase n=1 Tax=Phycisphaera mikurensis (strain NBRC 102666 / KCTC 22515 / FYK2301M01) TaxID=1142394 RepID=I0IIX9_PHYMF|nr:allantoinase AllB [Phycisphaera mikurensis]MBB6443398.1 allantoinase [Phycisphaera mikurensis]BAM05217.1 allantoinase [Phycisphaera mikurensis NBRC 102666]